MNSIKNIKGFTLIELLVSIAVTSIITLLIVNNFSDQSGDHAKQNQVAEMQQNLRSAMLLITGEIRKVGYDPDDKGTFGISNMGVGSLADPLTFTYDDRYDDDTNIGVPQTATINLFDSNIDIGNTEDEIQLTAAGTPIAGNIGALQFTYLKEDGTPAPTINDVRAIHILITARPDERERALGDTRTLESTVKCRNLGL